MVGAEVACECAHIHMRTGWQTPWHSVTQSAHSTRCVLSVKHTRTHKNSHALKQVHTRTFNTLVCIHLHTNTCTHTYTHTNTQMLTHMRTHRLLYTIAHRHTRIGTRTLYTAAALVHGGVLLGCRRRSEATGTAAWPTWSGTSCCSSRTPRPSTWRAPW